MKSKVLKNIALLAAAEIAGIFLLAAGLGVHNSIGLDFLPDISLNWALALVLLGSLALCVGMGLAVKLLFTFAKSAAQRDSNSKNTH